MTDAPAPTPAAAAPLEPPPTEEKGPRTRGGRLRPTILLTIPIVAFAAMWVVSQAWTAGDEAVADLVNANVDDAGKAAWRAGSWPGATLTGIVLAALGTLACLTVREWRAAGAVAGIGLLSSALVQGLKTAVGRDRPEGAVLDTYAFPSGHATTGMVAWGLLALVALPALARHVRFTPLSRRFAIGVWIGVAFATGACRVLGGVHWTSDVVAGWSFGGALLVLAVRAAHTDRPPPRAAPAT